MSPGSAVVLMLFVAGIGFSISAIRAKSIADEAEAIGEDRSEYFWKAFWSRHPDQVREVLGLKGRLNAAERRAAEERRRARRLHQDSVGGPKPILPAEPRTPAERMKDLQDLYQQGLINEDEFASKRREILGEV